MSKHSEAAAAAAAPVAGELMPASIPSAGQIFRWGLDHLDMVELIGDAAYDLSQATNFKQRGEIVGAVLPPVGAAVDDLVGPSISTVSDKDANELKSKLISALECRPKGLAVGAQARDGKWLDRFYDLFTKFILPILLRG